MTRPTDLPDFKDPPLNEVVVGVQFAQPDAYSQIRAGEVWSLFRDEYPLVEEQPPLPPSFETFGLPQAAQFNFGIVGTGHDRFWFLAPNRDQLIQFQHDRLLHNWRKVGDRSNEYPRFETIIERFENELRRVERYMATLAPQTLKINQAEVAYINLIPFQPGPGGDSCSGERWLKLFDTDRFEFEDFNCTFRRRIDRPTGKARLMCQAAAGARPSGERIINLTLTVRGAPAGDTIDAAVEFLKSGRQIIVEFFTQITTDQAHQVWKRTQ